MMPQATDSKVCPPGHTVKKDQIRIRFESYCLLLRVVVDLLIKEGVINEQQLHDKVVSRGLHWRNKALRDLLKALNTQ